MLKRTCHYYNSTGKCRFGKHCKFLHDIEIPSDETAANTIQNEAVNPEGIQQEVNTGVSEQTISVTSKNQNQDDSLKKEEEQASNNQNICRFYANNRFCRYGNRCKFSHVLPGKPIRREKRDLLKENVTTDQEDDFKQDQVQDEGQDVIGDGGEQGQAPPEKKKLCRFYKQGYCRYGRRCHFYHPEKPTVHVSEKLQKLSVTPGEDHKLNNKVDETAKETGEWKSVTRPPRVINVYKREDVDQAKLAELRETEIKQLKRRFPADKLKVLQESEELAAFIFTFLPTDPDWPFDVNSFEIQAEFGQDYPLKLFKVQVPLDQDLPATVQRYIEVSLQEWVEKKEEENEKKGIVELLFRPFLRWMDRTMETIVTEGLRQLRRELTAKAAGLQFISANELKKEREEHSSGESDHQEFEDMQDEKDSRRPVAYRKGEMAEDEVYEAPAHDSHEYEGGSSSGEEEEEEGHGEGNEDKVHQRPAIEPDTERRGTEMSFRNMQIWYCTTVMMEKLRILVHCERCKNTTDFVTPPNRVNSVTCTKCSNTQLVVFRPVLAHSYSSTFGYLDLDGCIAFDVILQDCHFSVGCIMCSRDILVKSFTPGRQMEIWCRGCHSKMKFAADSVKLAVISSDGVDQTKFSGKVHTVKVRKMQRVLKDPAIQEGKPLPDNGACKHYKKSFRWLRFPCCGKTYPCDICHDSKEDHEMKYANRMICGFCCREQPYAAERPCVGCSSALTKVRTSHWEGGRGCRDKIAMSKSDERKYTSMNKTVSNKAKALSEKNKGKKNTKLRHS